MQDYKIFIDDLKNKVDIVEVIGSFIPLRKSGKNYLSLCPFHQEKTPSFVVNREKNLYHCFGCGKGGTVFNFIMDYEKLSFNESVQLLARRYGITLPSFSPSVNRREALYKVNTTVAQFFHEYLKKNKGALGVREYLSQRKIDENSINSFLLGYSPSEAFLSQTYAKLGFSREELQNLGLLTIRNSKLEDTFKDRLIFPIFDISGRISGFAGRSLNEKIGPKYLNIGENILFKKSKLLYGFYQGKKSIANTQSVILVEGYFDVISMHQKGFDQVVGLMGTGLTLEHIDLLNKWVKEVIIMFDNDEGGLNATSRALELLRETDINVKVGVYRTKDPDELSQKYSKEEINNCLLNSLPTIEYIWNRLLHQSDLSSIEGKSSFIRRVINYLIGNANLAMVADIIKRTADKTSVKEDTLYAEIKRQKEKNRTPSQKAMENIIKPVNKNNLLNQVESYLAGALVKDGELFFSSSEGLTPEEISNPQLKQIFEKSFKYMGTEGILHIQPDDIDNLFTVEELRIVSGLLLNDNIELNGDIVKSMVRKLRMMKIQEDIEYLKREIKTLKKSSDYSLTRNYIMKLSNLISYLKELQG
ncbi:MAG: DNA primase [candidate division WS2 bacterium]|nr:DNA primase [Candidatus Lithacetigena glycinireducens]